MKNVFKSFFLLLSVAMIFGSCTDSAIETESQDVNLSQPLEDNHAMDDIVVADADKVTQTFEMPKNTIQTRSNCPAFDHAQSQYLYEKQNCNSSYLYCEYLKLFWQIDFHTAAIDCGWSIFCEPTYSAFQQYAAAKQITLAQQGLQLVYIQSLGYKLLAHQAAFNNNC